ncbi:hypothetical protein V1508DRAFT_83702 [Lipomyces doorenjongii]|uniref:uncharacterized protein n=1 Tax=Lipomyces doorenjongii TaxID=383834 RepID=UPI0034CF7E80
MANSPAAPTPGSSESLPSQRHSKPATCIDFVNPLLWVLFTNFAFSFGPSIMQATNATGEVKGFILAIGTFLFILSKLVEAVIVADLVWRSPLLSGRTVNTTILLAAHVGLFGPMFFSDLTLFARFMYILWSLSLGAFLGIWLAFGLGRSESNNKMGDRDVSKD